MSENIEIANIIANLIVIADNLDEISQIESDKIRSIANQLMVMSPLLESFKLPFGE